MSGLADDRRPDFFEKCSNLKQPYWFIKVHWSIKSRKFEREAIVLLSYQVNEAFWCTKGLYEMKN